MTALAQGSAGLALVMCFALLVTRQVGTAAILLAVQSGAVAVTAGVLHRPLLAIPPLVLSGGIWLIRRQTQMLDPWTAPAGGAKLGIGIGAVLAILCQSQGSVALPSAIILLSILLAATRSHPLMQIVALVAAQNGVALTGCLVVQPALLSAAPLLPIACLVLPLPLAGCLLVPAMASWRDPGSMRSARLWIPRISWGAAWFGWVDLGVATAMFAATLIVPLDSLASVFAPLFGLDGILRSCARQRRDAHRLRSARRQLPSSEPTGSGHTASEPLDAGHKDPPADREVTASEDPAGILSGQDVGATLDDRHPPAATVSSGHAAIELTVSPRGAGPVRRALALAQTGCTVLAICAPDLILAWLAILAAMALALLPTLLRRWSSAVLAFLAAALALFGILLLPAESPALGFFSLFVGFATIAVVVPDLAVVAVILILRLADQTPLPPGVATLGTCIALFALLGCAILLTNPVRSHRTTLLVLCQASVAALSIFTEQADGRFGALILLVLLILTRAAARITDGPVGTLAIAGLGSIPPLGVFPGLVLVTLAMSAHDPWLLLPLGVALVPIMLASLPRRLPDFSAQAGISLIAWLPLLLAVLVGYFAPNGLVHWLSILTAGRT
jgi:hypothetical protein